jgi:hypothetical protein
VQPKKPNPDDSQPAERPPGHFMDEKLAHDTARFIAEAKRMAERRARADTAHNRWDRR